MPPTHNPTIEDLQNEALYECSATIDHDDLIPFVNTYLFRFNPAIGLFVLINLTSLAAWIMAAQVLESDLGLLATSLVGLLVMLPLIPLHELLHGVVYSMQGARDIRYGGALRKLYFYAIAHRFVSNEKQMIELALAPLVVINLLCILVALVSMPLRAYALAVLFLHATTTSGDFAILSYLWEQRKKTVYSFDDAPVRKSYFFTQKSQ